MRPHAWLGRLALDGLIARRPPPRFVFGACSVAALGRTVIEHPYRGFGTARAEERKPLENVSSKLRSCKTIVVMVGAGMSVSAGIPDFRTPGTGLYDNLEKYNLPYPEAVFDMSFFRQNPKPFYALCRELWPGQYRPTLAHYFIALLHREGRLQRCYTQNIDSLETLAGLPKDKVVAAHGNFDGATCLANGRKVDPQEVRDAVFAGEAACQELMYRHGGMVKPDIVFFGENLPARFFQLVPEDFGACDALLILGTSLQVHPFAGLVCETRPGVPRILGNRDLVGESLGLRFEAPGSCDVFLQCDCDQAVQELAQVLGLESALMELHKESELSASAKQGGV